MKTYEKSHYNSVDFIEKLVFLSLFTLKKTKRETDHIALNGIERASEREKYDLSE